MQQILNKLFDYKTLTEQEAQNLFCNIVEGKYNEAQIASLMTVFLMRNISLQELDGFKNALFSFSKPISFNDNNYIDIVGTGGDEKNTFNISTCAAFVTAGAGYKVVKHGNYGSTSISGASDVLEFYGVKFSDSQLQHQLSLDTCNIAYLHAPVFNSAMRQVANVRKNLGIRNFFNMLGPMINPAKPKCQLLGTFNLAMQRLYCYAFEKNNVSFAVVHSLDGYDEISLTSNFKIVTPFNECIYSPNDLGFTCALQSELFGGETIAEAAKIFENVLNATANRAQINCVIVNAAFAIKLMQPELSISEAMNKAKISIESGEAKKCFNKFVEINS